MPEFYQWLSTREGPDVAFSFGAPPAIDPFLDDLWAGKRLRNAPASFNIHIPAPFVGRLTDDFTVLDHHLLLVAPRVVDVLRQCGVDNIETRPCILTVGDELSKAAPYLLVVIRDVVYCLDPEKSKLELDVENPRVIEAIENLAIDESRLGGNLIFRLGENRQVVIVHESVKDAVTSAGITGVRFAPVDGSVELPGSIDQVGGKWPEFVFEWLSKQQGGQAARSQ